MIKEYCDYCKGELPKVKKRRFSFEPEPFLNLHIYRYPKKKVLCLNCFENMEKFLYSYVKEEVLK